MSGILYLCATPIGNLEDLTFRALRILREVDLIAAEDTRQTSKLLNHYQISVPLTSYHRYNEKTKGEKLLALLDQGKKIALVSDAGTPGISDPGSHLVAQALAAGHRVIPVPGPTALIAALTVSGLDTRRFAFEGFLPRTKKDRLAFLAGLQEEERTLIFYEAPHRLKATLEALEQLFPRRKLAVARELTKKFEEVLRGTPGQLLAHFRQIEPQGEITIVMEGCRADDCPKKAGGTKEEDPWPLIRELKDKGLRTGEIAREVSRLLGISKREAYRLALQLEKKKNIPH
ncbi:MAG: 16S rRNA (cytidine(1402)-2'-O)-methyltransferase [Bacillota bacterium]|jgi:16S rRNA (cytidine1402-2'-O)-methyltransferase